MSGTFRGVGADYRTTGPAGPQGPQGPEGQPGDLADAMAYADAVGAGGVLLGSVSDGTGNFTTASGSLTDVRAMSVTVATGTRPIYVYFSADSINISAGIGGLYLVEDGTAVGVIGILTTAAYTFYRGRQRSPSAGNHTYKIQAKVISGGGTITIAGGDGTGTNNSPYRIHVEAK